MAMNQKQRDHFIDRVNDKCGSKIAEIKALNATVIQNISDAKYDEFIEVLGLKEDMQILQEAEQVQEEIGVKIKGTLQGLEDLHPNYKKNEYNDDNYFYASSSTYYHCYSKFLKACCKATAEKEFYLTDAGKELKALEDTRQQAVDTIMMDGSNCQDLTQKLNGILGVSGLQLLANGSQLG